MTKTLKVYFLDRLIGELHQTSEGRLEFNYLPDWLTDTKAIAISCSLPLQKEPFKHKSCHAFFAGLLPEDYQRKLIARNLGISPNNDFSILEQIGGECAGALSFLPADHFSKLNPPQYLLLTEKQLTEKIRELETRPLLAGVDGVRLSLAGVQEKMAVYLEEGKIHLPLEGAPSTHILKPMTANFENLIYNEAFCLTLGKKINLPTVKTEIHQVENIKYLLIERYDRKRSIHPNKVQQIHRIHQEDFCQALGVYPENKYQNEGGPSLGQCFNLLREESALPVVDIDHLLDGVIFNFLIGNCDAHGKNFSLLYDKNTRLAPFYDLVSTVYYKELSTKMAMKLGGEYNANKISLKNFEHLADEAGLSKPETRRRVIELTESVLSALTEITLHTPIEHELSKIIQNRCAHLIKRM